MSGSEDSSDSDPNSTEPEVSEEDEPVLTQAKQKTYTPSQASGSRSVNNTRHARGRSRDFGGMPTCGRGQGSRATMHPSVSIGASADVSHCCIVGNFDHLIRRCGMSIPCMLRGIPRGYNPPKGKGDTPLKT